MNNPMFNRFGGFANFMQQFAAFKKNIEASGLTPQQIVQQKLNSGEMTQDQFNQLRDMANMLTGRRN